eukprot:scaffold164624_cov31-Tisochrysis_lutea.AAC.1
MQANLSLSITPTKARNEPPSAMIVCGFLLMLVFAHREHIQILTIGAGHSNEPATSSKRGALTVFHSRSASLRRFALIAPPSASGGTHECHVVSSAGPKPKCCTAAQADGAACLCVRPRLALLYCRRRSRREGEGAVEQASRPVQGVLLCTPSARVCGRAAADGRSSQGGGCASEAGALATRDDRPFWTFTSRKG